MTLAPPAPSAADTTPVFLARILGDGPSVRAKNDGGDTVAVMAGGIVFVLVMVVAIPVGVMLAGAVWSAAFGWFASEMAADPDGEPG